MKKKFLAFLLAASMTAGSAVAASLPVMAAEADGTTTSTQETAAADGEVTGSVLNEVDTKVTSTHPGDLAEYLGASGSTIQNMFLISQLHETANTGSQYFTNNGIVFQTNADGEVEFINLYQASDFSIRGVKVGMDNPTVRAIFTQLGWKETILSTSIGDLWTFISPDGKYSSTVITDAQGIVLCIAVTALDEAAAE